MKWLKKLWNKLFPATDEPIQDSLRAATIKVKFGQSLAPLTEEETKRMYKALEQYRADIDKAFEDLAMYGTGVTKGGSRIGFSTLHLTKAEVDDWIQKDKDKRGRVQEAKSALQSAQQNAMLQHLARERAVKDCFGDTES